MKYEVFITRFNFGMARNGHSILGMFIHYKYTTLSKVIFMIALTIRDDVVFNFHVFGLCSGALNGLSGVAESMAALIVRDELK